MQIEREMNKRVSSKEDALLFKDIPVPSWKGGGGTLVREVLGGDDKTF